MKIPPTTLPNAFRQVPRTGVIYVTTEAQSLGFNGNNPDWCNLGQGQPDCGVLPGGPPRTTHIDVDYEDLEYAPVAGLPQLRAAVADMYNRLFRKGKRSQYTPENVAISAGGRVALTRAAAALGSIHTGHFLPDYTAYEELLDIFRLFTPIPIPLDPERNYEFTAGELWKEIVSRGLSAILMSNPCNPTGALIHGPTLADWVGTARRLDCTLLIDEFYSHYIWNNGPPVVSAAEYVEDVDRDPVVLFDGLTKNWRYSGWRIAWTVGPRSVINAVSSAGSFLDGGAPRPLQRAAVPLLSPEIVEMETAAIRDSFLEKRSLMLNFVRSMGLKLDGEPQGTFYAFVNLSDLPESLADGMRFFRAALAEKVICVPGEFFDVNPGKKRRHEESRFSKYVRLSFGPSLATVKEGCDRLESLIARHRFGGGS